MQRPTLHPSAHLELAEDPPVRPRRSLGGRVFWAIGKVLAVLFRPLPGSRPHEAEEHSPLIRIVRGLMYRIALALVLLGLTTAVLVHTATHPVAVPTFADPSSLGLYFEKVTLESTDKVRSTAWFVPTINAERVLEDKDSILTERRAAVVLVHDQSYSAQQMLPYIRPLNDAGLMTLTIQLRGTGTDQPRARTFGLREVNDVMAGIAFLRTRPTVDPGRIAVFGIGTGATAALLAAKQDPRIQIVAASSPAADGHQLVEPIAPRTDLLKFLGPLSRWAFEAAYEVDSRDADLSRLTSALRERQVLYLLPEESAVSSMAMQTKTVTHFLKSRLNGSEFASTPP